MADKALLVGINSYADAPLEGCVNDVMDMAELLVKDYGFARSSIRLLVDKRATTSAIISRLHWLVDRAQHGDRLVFLFSGHGTQVADRDHRDEVDGLDEVLCPYDFDWSPEHMVKDDTLFTIFKKVPAGAKFYWLSDCCLGGSTKVPLLDGSAPTIEELVGRKDGFWVYSAEADGSVVPGWAHSARFMRDAELVRVVLDNGDGVDATEDHLFMLRDGTFKKAGSLNVGDSLMPFYRRVGSSAEGFMEGYELVGDPATPKWTPTHRLVADACGLRLKGRGHVVHHINFNKRDNRPENLIEVSWRAHKRMHGEVGRVNFNKMWADPAYQAWRKSADYKKAQAVLTRASWRDPKVRQRHLEGLKRRLEREGGLPAKFVAYNFSEENRENTRRRHQPGGDLYEAVRSPENSMRMKTLRKSAAFRAAANESRRRLLADPTSKLCKSLHSKERADHCRLISRYANLVRWGKIDKTRLPFAEWKKTLLVPDNHKVISVVRTGRYEPTYDLTVDGYHNFAVGAGVFVHNCHSGTLTRDFFAPQPKKTRASKRKVETREKYLRPPADMRWRHHVAVSKGITTKPVANPKLHVGFVSGCRDNQTSADASFGGRPNGAMTYYFLKALKKLPKAPLTKVVEEMRKQLKAAGYDQVPLADGMRAGRAFLE